MGGLTYPFARSAHDVTTLLAAKGEQALAVKITPMPFPGSPGDKGPAGLSFVDAGATMMNRNSPTYLAVLRLGLDAGGARPGRRHLEPRAAALDRRTPSSATPGWTPGCPTCPTPAAPT